MTTQTLHTRNTYTHHREQEDLSKFVRLCFDYSLTGQAQEKVGVDRLKESEQEGVSNRAREGVVRKGHLHLPVNFLQNPRARIQLNTAVVSVAFIPRSLSLSITYRCRGAADSGHAAPACDVHHKTQQTRHEACTPAPGRREDTFCEAPSKCTSYLFFLI